MDGIQHDIESIRRPTSAISFIMFLLAISLLLVTN